MSASVVLQEIIVRCCVRTGFALVSFLASMQTHMMSFKITFVGTFEHTYFALVNTAFRTLLGIIIWCCHFVVYFKNKMSIYDTKLSNSTRLCKKTLQKTPFLAQRKLYIFENYIKFPIKRNKNAFGPKMAFFKSEVLKI